MTDYLLSSYDASKLDAPSLWLGEPNPTLRLALEKTAEEASELAHICSRAAMQGIEGLEPKTKKPNRLALIEELADRTALFHVLTDELNLTEGEREFMEMRAQAKYAHKTEWLSMVRAYWLKVDAANS